MSQMRLNQLTGRWVTIVAERAQRPSAFAPRARLDEPDESRPCPFCSGNEDATPPAVTNGIPKDDAIQVPVNSLIVINLTDNGDGIDPRVPQNFSSINILLL